VIQFTTDCPNCDSIAVVSDGWMICRSCGLNVIHRSMEKGDKELLQPREKAPGLMVEQENSVLPPKVREKPARMIEAEKPDEPRLEPEKNIIEVRPRRRFAPNYRYRKYARTASEMWMRRAGYVVAAGVLLLVCKEIIEAFDDHLLHPKHYTFAPDPSKEDNPRESRQPLPNKKNPPMSDQLKDQLDELNKALADAELNKAWSIWQNLNFIYFSRGKYTEELQPYKLLIHYVNCFWQGVGLYLDGGNAVANELKDYTGEIAATVVEVTSDKVIIMARGRNKTFYRTSEDTRFGETKVVHGLPPEMAMALYAHRVHPRDQGFHELCEGAYLISQGDRERVKVKLKLAHERSLRNETRSARAIRNAAIALLGFTKGSISSQVVMR